MRSSLSFSQPVSVVGYEYVEYENEFFNHHQKYMDDALIDPRWRDCEDNAAYHLATKDDPTMSLREKKNAFAFREFAQLSRRPDKREDILQFAGRYGFLGVPAWQSFGGVKEEGGIVNPSQYMNFIYAERFDDWNDQIGKMQKVLQRFELLLQCRDSELEGYQKVTAREQLGRLFYGGTVEVLGSRVDEGDAARIRKELRNHPDILRYCDDDDMESAELAYITLLTNREIHRLTALTLAWKLDDKSPALQFRTTTLIGALWLQFAEYVTQARRMNFCRMCNKPIPIVGRSTRSDNDLCSGKCRQRASREGKTVRHRKTAS